MNPVNYPDELESPNDKFFTHPVVDWFLKNAGTTATWNWTTTTDNRKEQFEALYTKLVESTNVILSKGGKGLFWIVVHPRMFDFISNTTTKFVTTMTDQFPLGYNNILFMGILDKRWRLYTDNLLDPNTILIGAGFTKKHNNYYLNMKIEDFYNPLKIDLPVQD